MPANILDQLKQIDAQKQSQGDSFDVAGFQQFIAKKYPNLDKGNAANFQNFIKTQQQSQLVEKGGMPYADLVKANPGAALGLINKGYKPQPEMTAEQRNRAAALKPAKTLVENAKSLKIDKAGTKNVDIVRLKQNFPFGLGKKYIGEDEQELVDLDQNFQLLRQNVVRALQGARMSDTDIKMAESYIPSAQDSPATIRTNLKNLEGLINSLSGEDLSASSNYPKDNSGQNNSPKSYTVKTSSGSYTVVEE